jgi:4-hydroxybenzoate polyprenyltransferase
MSDRVADLRRPNQGSVWAETPARPMAGEPDRSIPLCVDLDGTLLRSDSLVEGLLTLATGWRIVPGLWRLLSSGRAAFKAHVAGHAPLDPALLPYNERLLDYLRAERAAGRRLVLATAADASIAHAVARHLGLFDEVVASDGTNNLKGAAKARALAARFGEKGFAYAGDAASDLDVWRVARQAVIVNASSGTRAAARALVPVEAEIDDRGSRAAAAVRALRPHQWLKNLLVFIPLFTAHDAQAHTWLAAALIFISFCSTASAIYILNDLLDLAADRRHPRKRHRPFASGALPIPTGIAMMAFFLGMGLWLAYANGSILVLLAYGCISVGYSFRMKELPIVDVFLLAALYTIRLFGGGEATGHSVSLWLLGFSSFLFLSLALVKRVEELMQLAASKGGTASRRGYLASDAAILQLFGCGAAFASSLVLALFVQSEATAQRYASPGLLWGIVPLTLFWQCRLWLSTARGYMHDDPIVYAARDWVSWAVAITTFAVLALAKAGIPFLR